MLNTSIKNLLIIDSSTLELLPSMERFQLNLKHDNINIALNRLVDILLDESCGIAFTNGGGLYKRAKGDSTFSVYGLENKYHGNDGTCILWKKYARVFITCEREEFKEGLKEEIDELHQSFMEGHNHEHELEYEEALKLVFEMFEYAKM